MKTTILSAAAALKARLRTIGRASRRHPLNLDPPRRLAALRLLLLLL